MKKKIDISEYANIKSLFDAKVSISQMANQYGVTRPAIYTALRRGYGIVLKSGNAKHKDKIGKTFGYLLIKDLVQRGKQFRWQYRAICECSNCGNKNFETSIQSILSGRTTSCGCRRDQYEKTTGKYSKQFTGYEEIRGAVWAHFKSRARKRDMDFSITLQQAWELYEKQKRKCALTGLQIVFGRHRKVTTASLDRIDSLKGYTIDNVQWVHKDVNIMKSVFPVKYFISICGLIYKNNRKVTFDPKLKEGVNFGDFNKIP